MDTEVASTWTIGQLLQWIHSYFARHGLESPRLDGELLLAHVLGQERIYLYTHYDQPLEAHERLQLRQLVQRRVRREPIAYLLGEKHFYGRSFLVTPDVLIPRPETEELLDWLLALLPGQQALQSLRGSAGEEPLAIWDVGTGSGVLPISLAHQWPHPLRLWASDTEAAALKVAQANCERHGLQGRIQWVQGSLCEPMARHLGGPALHCMVANLPYVPNSAKSQLAADVVDYEPHTALFAQQEGLALIQALLQVAPTYLLPQGVLLLEIGVGQAESLCAFAQQLARYSHIEIRLDLSGKQRFLCLQRGD